MDRQDKGMLSEFLFAELAEGEKPVEVLRVGTFVDRHGQTVEIAPEDLDVFVSNFAAGEAGQEVPLDINHERGEAGGWVRRLWKEGEKLLASVDWNELGRKLVGDKVYRYLSATIDLERKLIKSISLVNFPAVKGLKPVELSEGVYELQGASVGAPVGGLMGRIADVLMEFLGVGAAPESVAEDAEFVIQHEDDKWILYTADGKKRLGTYDSEDAAKKRERQIQFFKHKHAMMGDVEMRKKHSDAWHRCWEKVKGKYPSDSAAAICTWSVGRPPNPPDVYEAQEGDGRIRLTVDEAAEIDEGLADEMRQHGIQQLWIDPQTWEVEEVHTESNQEEQMDEKELAELKEKIRKEMEAEMAEKGRTEAELREQMRQELTAELTEKMAKRQKLVEFAASVCGGEAGLSAKPEDVIAVLEKLPEDQVEGVKALLQTKVVDFGERGNSRDGQKQLKALPEEYAAALDAGKLKVADLSQPIMDLGDLSEYDLSRWKK